MWREIAVPVVAMALCGGGAGAQEIDPAQLQIVEGRALTTESGFVRIAGEIRNNSQQWLLKPRIAVELRDKDGRPIQSDSVATAVSEERGWGAQEFVYTERTYIPPGEVGVFEFFRDSAKLGGRYAGHKLTLASSRVATNPPRMTLEGFATENQEDYKLARGRLKNSGQVGCYSPKVVLALYGADGRLQREEHDNPDASFQKTLGAGQSVAFEVRLYPDESGAIASVKAWADCEEPY